VTRPFLLLDVDNTLYPPARGVVDRVDRLINRYLVERLGVATDEVDALRHGLWRDWGTTLHGLVHRHHAPVDADDYLSFVHAIELDDLLGPDPVLEGVLSRIGMLKVAVTNGSHAHAAAVLGRLGVRPLFFRIHALERLHYLPKPYVHAYHAVLADLHARGSDCVLVEDSAVNLRAARQLGMRTIHVGEQPAAEADVRIPSIHRLEAALAALG